MGPDQKSPPLRLSPAALAALNTLSCMCENTYVTLIVYKFCAWLYMPGTYKGLSQILRE